MMRIQFALTCLASRYSNRFLWAAEMEEIRVGNNHKQWWRSLGARSLIHDIDSTHMYGQTFEAVHLRLNNLIGRDAPHIVATNLIMYGLRLVYFAPQGFHFLMEAKDIHALRLFPVGYHLLFSPEYICWKCTLGTTVHSQKVFFVASEYISQKVRTRDEQMTPSLSVVPVLHPDHLNVFWHWESTVPRLCLDYRGDGGECVEGEYVEHLVVWSESAELLENPYLVRDRRVSKSRPDP